MGVHPPLRFDQDAVHSAVYDDRYKSRAGAFAEVEEVLIAGCGLDAAWADAAQFTILEVGFGLGVSFLATLAHWLADPQRSQRLNFVSLEQHPVSAEDLAAALRHLEAPAELAAELIAQWPPAIEGPHRLRFAGGRVTLQLVLGDARRWLPRLALTADAIHLDGFAPERNPEAWEPVICRALGRLARTGARLSTYTAAAEVRRQLTAAGFDMRRVPGFGGKRERLEGTRAARLAAPGTPPRPVGPVPQAARGRQAIVVGAGLAGCAITSALLARGWRITLIEAADEAMGPASASAQPLCAEHLHLAPDDNPLARLSRAAWMLARPQTDRREIGRLLPALDASTQAAQQHLLERLAWPASLLSAVDAATADALAGVTIGRPALWWPGAAIVDPRERAHRLLSIPHPALSWRPGCPVAGIRWTGASEARPPSDREAGLWQVLDGKGRILAEAPTLILANAGAAPALAGLDSLPLQERPGRSRLLTRPTLAGLRCILSTRGYVLPVGDGRILIDPDNPPEGVLREPSEATAADPDPDSEPGPAATRFAAPDHLPVIGAVPDEARIIRDPAPWQRNDRLPLPMRPGLHLACAFGSRGLLWSTLAAEVLVAQLEGDPAPIDQSLLDAIAPARFLRRALRRSQPQIASAAVGAAAAATPIPHAAGP